MDGERARKSFSDPLQVVAGADSEAISGAVTSWAAMMVRCYTDTSNRSADYRGRGIVVCDAWQSLSGFLMDMGARPLGQTLDRIDNDGNYEPSNCRWATPKQQARNTRRNRYLEVDGVRMLMTDAADAFGLRNSTLFRRLARGATPSDAVRSNRAIKMKLCADDVALIRVRLAAGDATKVIAAAFGVTRQAISGIRTGRAWGSNGC